MCRVGGNVTIVVILGRKQCRPPRRLTISDLFATNVNVTVFHGYGGYYLARVLFHARHEPSYEETDDVLRTIL